MRLIYKISQYQPHMVSLVAVAYLGAQVAGKVLCSESKDLGPSKCFVSSPFCEAPKEFTIPVTFVASGTSGTLAQSAVTFAPQIVWDSEDFTFPLI